MKTNIISIGIVALSMLFTMGCGGGDTEGGQTDRDAGADPSAAEETRETDPRAGWVSYNHPLGATLKHPEGWTTQEGQMGVVLLPKGVNPQQVPGGILIVVWGGPDIINDPLAPQSAQMLGQALMSVLPGFQQAGEPRKLETGHGPGAVYTYSGAVPNSDWDTAEVRYTASEGVGLGITVVGSGATLKRYADDLELVFTSLAIRQDTPAASGAGSAVTDDVRLIGAYSTEAYAGGGGIHVNTQLLYVLNADGTFLSGARSFMNASQRDANGNLKWTAGQDTANNVMRGTWSAKGGFLTVVMSNGQRSVVAYGFEPDGTLATRDPTTRKLINIYRRTQ